MTSFRKVCLILFLSSFSEAFTMTPVNSNNRSTITQLAITTGDNDSEIVIDSRRTVFRKAAFAAASLVAFSPVLGANALDMEAFANAEVSIKMMADNNEKERGKKNPIPHDTTHHFLYLIFCFAYTIIFFLSFLLFTIYRSNRMSKIATPKMIQDAYRY
jgi:heme/copper-type cytochrome/quinol oxidase subunit 3